jgi:hypothetical protein
MNRLLILVSLCLFCGCFAWDLDERPSPWAEPVPQKETDPVLRYPDRNQAEPPSRSKSETEMWKPVEPAPSPRAGEIPEAPEVEPAAPPVEAPDAADPREEKIRKLEERIEAMKRMLREREAIAEREDPPPSSPEDEKTRRAVLHKRRALQLKKIIELDWALGEVREKVGEEVFAALFGRDQGNGGFVLRGKVVAGDSPKQLAALHLGWRHGVRAGTVFKVVRALEDGRLQVKAEVVVIRVEGEKSTAQITRVVPGEEPVKPGDSLFTKLFRQEKSGVSQFRYGGSVFLDDPKAFQDRLKSDAALAGKGTFRIRVGRLEKPLDRLEDLEADVYALKKQESDLNWILTRIQQIAGGHPRPYELEVPPKIDGQVVGVSQKMNLIVINVGEDDGVRVGFEFTVYRGKNYVGKAIVEKVFPRQSACRVLLDKTKGKIQAGDKVSTQVY